MDVSPIQRLAMQASEAVKPVAAVPKTRGIAPPAQAAPVPADQSVTDRESGPKLDTRVLVEWHAASLGYVTSVVDQHSGAVLYQTPPEQVLNMVEKVIEGMQGENT